jgi:putative hydrolase of the HAD superfamily
MNKILIGLVASSLLFCANAQYCTIIFDIGGVILADDFLPFIEQEFKDEKEVPYYLLEACNVPLWQEWNKGLVTQEELIDYLSTLYKREYVIRLLQVFQNPNRAFIEETIHIIQKLKSAGYRLYILSNLPKETYEIFVMQRPEFFEQFDGMCFSFQTGTVKPDLEIYDYILKTYDLDPSECVFIDDREQNIIAAQQKDINGIVYKKNMLAQELLKFGITL